MGRFTMLEIVERLLPEYCYDTRRLPEIQGLVVGAVSAQNMGHAGQFELDACWELFHEFNLGGEHRGAVLARRAGLRRGHVSTHYLVGRGGEVLRLVPDDNRAYHSGISSFRGRVACNRFMLGASVVGTLRSGFTEEQYVALAQLIQLYQVTVVVGAEHVNEERNDPGREFDWNRLAQEAGLESLPTLQ